MIATTEKKGAALIEPRKAAFQPPRLILNAVEGWGKTSCAAYTPKPVLLMAKGETGYDTLLGAGLVPAIPATITESWKELLATCDEMIAAPELPYKTLNLDASGGFERMCHEYVCQRDFKGDWGEKGFTSFQKGYDVAVAEWLQLLTRLDRIRERGVMIIFLGHSKVTQFSNPMGENFDRYISDMHHKTTGVTSKWADAILFGTFVTVTEKSKTGKHKGIGGTERILYTERRDAFDAKNRYGMPPEIDIPDDPSKTWSTIWQHIYRKDK
jgi:hypothetical protein